MTDYLQPLGDGTRRLTAVICLPAAIIATAVTALVVDGMIREGRFDHNGKPIWIAAVVCGAIALACWWLSARLLIGRSPNGVTVLPLWFIELTGLVLLTAFVWLWVVHDQVWGAPGCIGVISAMLLVRRAVRRRSRLKEEEANLPAEPGDPVARPGE
jgi:hypothetical protein